MANEYHEYEQELIEAFELEMHEIGKCAGAPRCGYCLDYEQLLAELEREEGYYDWKGHWRQ
jgi:hypothetical protein